jgi:uncharacterized protein YkwD
MDPSHSPTTQSRRSSGRLLALLLAGHLAVAGCGDLATTTAAADVALIPPDGVSAQAVALIDAHRATHGCGSLAWHSPAAIVAGDHSRQMGEQGFFGHVDPQGRTLRARLHESGIFDFRAAGETLAGGQDSAAKVVSAWIQSPPHEEILRNCRFSHVAIGVHEGAGPYRVYWTAIFLDRR